MRHTIKTVCGAFLFSLISVSSASAAPITLNFSGTVQFVNSPALFPLASPGATLSGSITYESTTPDLALDPNVGAYNGAVTAFSYSINTISGSSAGGSIGIGNNYAPPNPSNAGDVFQALGASSFTSVSGASNLDYQLRLVDNQATALSSDSLPLNAGFFGGGAAFSGISDQASLTLFQSNGAFGFTGVSDDTLISPQFQQIALYAIIDSVTSEVSAVSEPAIIALFGLGALSLGIANRRAKRKSKQA